MPSVFSAGLLGLQGEGCAKDHLGLQEVPIELSQRFLEVSSSYGFLFLLSFFRIAL